MNEAPYEVTMEPAAINAAAGFLHDDPRGVGQLISAIDALALDPEPATSFPFGPGRRRLHAGPYRVLYEIDTKARSILVVRLGRTRTAPND